MRVHASVRLASAVRWLLVRQAQHSSMVRFARVRVARFGLVVAAVLVVGCVIPIAPEFEVPEGNLSPYIVTAEPRENAFVAEDQEIAVVVGDPNLADTLYYRWVFNYPPFTLPASRWSVEDTIPAALGGSPVRNTTIRIRPACFRDLVPGSDQHRAMLVVSDRPFVEDPDDAQHPFDQVPAGAFVVRASWTVRKACVFQ